MPRGHPNSGSLRVGGTPRWRGQRQRHRCPRTTPAWLGYPKLPTSVAPASRPDASWPVRRATGARLGSADRGPLQQSSGVWAIVLNRVDQQSPPARPIRYSALPRNWAPEELGAPCWPGDDRVGTAGPRSSPDRTCVGGRPDHDDLGDPRCTPSCVPTGLKASARSAARLATSS